MVPQRGGVPFPPANLRKLLIIERNYIVLNKIVDCVKRAFPTLQLFVLTSVKHLFIIEVTTSQKGDKKHE